MRKSFNKMQVIKISILFLSIFMVTACSIDNSQLDSDQVGKEVIDLLIAEDYLAIYDDWFSEELRESLSLNDFRSTWEDPIARSGEFIEIDSIDQTQTQNYSIVEATLAYTDVMIDIRMVVNEHQQLAGFNVTEGALQLVLPDTLVEEEIVVGAGTEFELNGILTVPKEQQEGLPAVVLVHGSGAHNRDQEIYGNKVFRDLAWGLAEQGIAVIRYDKRTYAHHIQDVESFTVYEETIEDAILAGQLLREDKRIDENNVFLIGLSLGGMLAPRIQYQGGEFAGLISLAGSPRMLWEIMYDQQLYFLERENLDETTRTDMIDKLNEQFEIFEQLLEMTAEEAQQQSVFGINGYYFQDLGQFDVANLVANMDIPMLILQGEADFQVYYEKDFALWQEILEEYDHATFISYPNLNHLFMYSQGPNKGTVAEYEIPSQVEPVVIQDIGSWILENLN